MDLLEEYKQANEEFENRWREYSELLSPLSAKVDELIDKVEVEVLKNSIYLPYEELIKYSGVIEEVEMVVRYGEGYERIEHFTFKECEIKDGVITDSSTELHWVHLGGNKYKYVDEDGQIIEIVEILGFYDLAINGHFIEETQLDTLWREHHGK